MKFHLVYATLGLAGVFGAPAAQTQTVITPAPVVIAQPPLVTAPAPALAQPAETVRTTRTVRTVHTMVPIRQRIVTTRTVTRRVMPAEPAIATATVAAAPAPQAIYDVAPAVEFTPVADISPPPAYGYRAPAYDYGYRAPTYDYAYRAPAYNYTPPLYDVAPAPVVTAPAAVAPAPVVAAPAAAIAPAPVIAAPVATAPMIYRYVYEPDRILVVDPTTNIAVQAIPR